MTRFKYQEEFAIELAQSWVNGNKSHVRLTIRELKNKAQAAYVAIMVYGWLAENDENALAFLSFMHPNNA